MRTPAGTGTGSSGVHIDGDGHVLDEAGNVIPGLYAVGSVAALTTTGSGYNSGFALGRGITPAYRSRTSRAPDPSELTPMCADPKSDGQDVNTLR
ncbi:FAD-binding protein [Nonomuraea sp. NPDC048916]|uniref:FAD-binding protein n=1 Tax=Nonomuraea sp. NPDC048916 TaxID=3154232 RepID=UPI0033F92098